MDIPALIKIASQAVSSTQQLIEDGQAGKVHPIITQKRTRNTRTAHLGQVSLYLL